MNTDIQKRLHNLPSLHGYYGQDTHDQTFGQIKSFSNHQTSQKGVQQVCISIVISVCSQSTDTHGQRQII